MIAMGPVSVKDRPAGKVEGHGSTGSLLSGRYIRAENRNQKRVCIMAGSRLTLRMYAEESAHPGCCTLDAGTAP
ncbi:hypothetical protein CGRA01v4_11488 [Colletotrichum graminicola]|nr:hypothetical protein CGRA01v4_11488 [Colletotrichum graminicola]